MPRWIDDRLLSWADDLDEKTVEQARQTARLPVVHDHVALMADAHLGYGATVGSVIPTRGAVIPSAVGVDIGCGMSAVRLDIDAAQLPDDLDPLVGRLGQAIPAGVGVGHGSLRGHDPVIERVAKKRERQVVGWMSEHQPRTDLKGRLAERAHDQAGSLGSGNHFAELSVDREGGVWFVLHSGSRGVGNTLATKHIDRAKGRFDELLREIGARPGEYPKDLAWLVEGTEPFQAYITDMLWAQDYAAFNRRLMLEAAIAVVADFLGLDPDTAEVDRVSCHHNYCVREVHDGVEVWVTRKGAIRAGDGDRGIIPGSMGTSTFLVTGQGNDAAWHSSSHGAGRRMSRRAAKRNLDLDEFKRQMKDRAWQERMARKLLDEAPGAYKDVHEIIRAQADLVTVDAELEAVANYKGT